MGIVGVVPACAIQACSAGTSAPVDAGDERILQGVALGFDGPMGVAASCFTSPNLCPDVRYGVADAAFRPDAGDGNDEIQESGPDQIFTVAFIGFVDLEKSGKQRA
jgi:hypothetical protein